MFCIFNPIGRIKQKDLSAKHRTFYITNWTVLKSVTIKKESALIAAVMLIKNQQTFPSASPVEAFSTLFLFKIFFTHSST